MSSVVKAEVFDIGVITQLPQRVTVFCQKGKHSFLASSVRSVRRSSGYRSSVHRRSHTMLLLMEKFSEIPRYRDLKHSIDRRSCNAAFRCSSRWNSVLVGLLKVYASALGVCASDFLLPHFCGGFPLTEQSLRNAAAARP